MEINVNVKIKKTTINRIVEQLAKDAPDNIRAGYLIGRVESHKVVVEGVYVPEQHSCRAWADISAKSELKAFQAINTDGKRVVGFVVYFASFPVYESATTRKSRKMLSQTIGAPDLSVVVNSKRDFKVFYEV